MEINKANFKEFLSGYSFLVDGDDYEKRFGPMLQVNFPNLERFWQTFVVPFTQGINDYPDKGKTQIELRPNINVTLETIANDHYSMFLNLVFAKNHLDVKMVSSFENIYAHLGSVCDLAEKVIARIFLLLMFCRGESVKTEGLTKDCFLSVAAMEYDKNYPKWYENYIRFGKFFSIPVVTHNDFMVQYLGRDDAIRKEYASIAQFIRQMRNVIVHNVRVGRIVFQDGKQYVPKSQKVNLYRSWDKVREIIGNPEVIARDFCEQFEQASDDLSNLEIVLNKIWDRLISSIENEFYSGERDNLREMYDLQMNRLTVVGLTNTKVHPNLDSALQRIPPSGDYVGDDGDDNIFPRAGSADPYSELPKNDE